MSSSNKIIHSMIWKFLERFSTVGIQFIIQIILARILSPNDYGIIAIITIFITVANVFVQNGFNTALIQNKNVKEEDYSSVFWMSLFVACICYAVLYFIAPVIGDFYKMPILVDVLRILGVTLFFGAYNSIQVAKISREFKFKMLFYSSVFGILVSGVIGIVLAYQKFGVWALVIQQLVNQLIVSLVLLKQVHWRLRFKINFTRLKTLFSFGSKLLLSSLIDVIYNNLYNLVIGKIFTSKLLGFYNRADQFPNIVVSNVNGSIQSVILPALSEHQDSSTRVKILVRKAMSLSSFIVFPLMFGMAACAYPMVNFLLTDKWLPCVPMIQLLCFSYTLWPIHTANLQAISAVGRSDIYLRLEIVKKAIGIISLVVSIPFGIMAMIIMKLIVSIISTFINAYPNKSLLTYGYKEQFEDIFPSLITSIIMFSVVLVFNNLILYSKISDFFVLILDVILGSLIYFGANIITRNKNIHVLYDILRNNLKQN